MKGETVATAGVLIEFDELEGFFGRGEGLKVKRSTGLSGPGRTLEGGDGCRGGLFGVEL